MSMNLIGNSCISAYIQKYMLNQQFENPFCWCTVSQLDMSKLILNYDKINWADYRLIVKNNFRYISVSHLFCIKYVHYHYDKTAETPRFVKGAADNIYYKDINKYVIDKYEIRTERMLKANNEPIFIIGNIFEDQKVQFNIATNLIKTTNYKIIFVSSEEQFLTLKSANIDVVLYDINTLTRENQTQQLAEKVFADSSFFK